MANDEDFTIRIHAPVSGTMIPSDAGQLLEVGRIRAAERLRIVEVIEGYAALCSDPNSHDAMVIKGCAAAVRGMR